MKLIVLLLLALTAPCFAKGSSHPKAGEQAGAMVNASVAPRARIWYDDRLWQTAEGQILVCDEQFKVDYKKCYAKGDKNESDRWAALPTKHSDGFVLKGYEYRFIGSSGYKILIAYYGPPEADTEDRPITITGPVTIKGDVKIDANRVNVWKKK